MEGKILAGRYRLLQKLGQGGMGAVWRAEHVALGTPVAIKLIDASIADSTDAFARFKREAQSAAELRSAHVVHIIDYGIDQSIPYIAMELLDGESLASRLARLGRLTPACAADILSQVGRALSRAHSAGIVHRDLKPENIFLVSEEDEEIAKVLDFGIAKRVNALSLSGGVKTSTGALLGSPLYMSPEQARGKTQVDHRTDIWSLAVIAYQCITGARPFQADNLGALLFAICSDPMPVPSHVCQVPAGFDAWFAHAAARDPAARFATASEATAELRAICCPRTTGEFNTPPTRAEGVAATSTAPLTSAAVKTPADLGQTAVPSSVTVSALSSVQNRLFLAGAATMALFIGALALRSLRGTNDNTLTGQPSAGVSTPDSEQWSGLGAPTALQPDRSTAPAHKTSAQESLGRADTNQSPNTQPLVDAAVTVVPASSAASPVSNATSPVSNATSPVSNAVATAPSVARSDARGPTPLSALTPVRSPASSAAPRGGPGRPASKPKKDLTLDQKAGF